MPRTTPPHAAQSTQALPSGRGALGFEGLGVNGLRDAVERHVHEGCDAAGGSGLGRCLKALPLGAAGLVDVDVRVDKAGQQKGIAKVAQGAGRRRFAPTEDCSDAPILHQQRSGCKTIAA